MHNNNNIDIIKDLQNKISKIELSKDFCASESSNKNARDDTRSKVKRIDKDKTKYVAESSSKVVDAQENSQKSVDVLGKEDTQSNLKTLDKFKNSSSENERCFFKMIKLINYRERCSTELKNRLVNLEKFSEKSFNYALDKCIKLQLLDDNRYCEMYIRSKLANGYGVNRILRHLSNLNLDYRKSREAIKLIETANITQKERAYNYISNHKSRAKNEFIGNMNKLVFRGYSSSDAYYAAKKISSGGA